MLSPEAFFPVLSSALFSCNATDCEIKTVIKTIPYGHGTARLPDPLSPDTPTQPQGPGHDPKWGPRQDLGTHTVPLLWGCSLGSREGTVAMPGFGERRGYPGAPRGNVMGPGFCRVSFLLASPTALPSAYKQLYFGGL